MIVPADVCEPISAGMVEALRKRWPNGERLAVSFALALDLATCADLLDGLPVAPGRLDADALATAKEATLVRLVRPVDLLLEAAA